MSGLEKTQCIQFLANTPLAARERVEISPAVRIHPIDVHWVIYRVEDNGDVLIIHVRHGHEDWQAFAGTEQFE